MRIIIFASLIKYMRFCISLFLCLAFANLSSAQTYEIGVWGGGSNLVGDVGATNYINPNALALGGVLKWNRSYRHSFRASLIYTDLTGDDANSDDPSRVQRDLSFKSSLLEASLGIEYTFWEWNLYQSKPQFTPYIYSGISAIRYEENYLDQNEELTPYKKSISLALPIVLGFKTRLIRHVVISAEIGARYSFTDNLDGSQPTDIDNAEQISFGNLNNKDWYIFSGISISYTFGKKPCYCNF